VLSCYEIQLESFVESLEKTERVFEVMTEVRAVYRERR